MNHPFDFQFMQTYDASWGGLIDAIHIIPINTIVIVVLHE